MSSLAGFRCRAVVVVALLVLALGVASVAGVPNVRYVQITSKPGYAVVLNEVQVYPCGSSTNVARNKSATGTALGVSCTTSISERYPSIAVDGLSSCDAGFSDTFCSDPNGYSVATWEVDLGQEYDICTVSLIQTKAGAATLMLDALVFYRNISSGGGVALATTELPTNRYAMLATCGATSCTVTPATCVACSSASTCNGRSTNASAVTGSYPACACSCKPRYYGAYCETASVCTAVEDCSNHSLSVSGTYPSCTCACRAPWSGPSCAIRACVLDVDCNAAGTSGVSGTYPSCACSCVLGFSGPTCSHTWSVSQSAARPTASETASHGSLTRMHSASSSNTGNRASVSTSMTARAASGTASSSRGTDAATASRSRSTSHSAVWTFSKESVTLSLNRPTATLRSISGTESPSLSAPTREPSRSGSLDVGTLTADTSVSSNRTTASASISRVPHCDVPFSSVERYLHSGNSSSNTSQQLLSQAVSQCEAFGRQCVGVAMNERRELFVPSVMWYTSPPPVMVVVLPDFSSRGWSLDNVSADTANTSVFVAVAIPQEGHDTNDTHTRLRSRETLLVLWFVAADQSATWRSISLLASGVGGGGGGVVLLPLHATCRANQTVLWVTVIPVFPPLPSSQIIAATTTALIGASSGGDLTSAAATLLLSTLSCTATSRGTSSSERISSSLISPFFSRGPAAMAWGNAAVVVCVAMLHLAVVVAVMRFRRVSFVAVAGGKLRFPALSLQIADCWMPGVALGATAALLQTHQQENTTAAAGMTTPRSGSLPLDQFLLFAMLVVALLYPLVCTVTTLHWILPRCRWGAYDVGALPTGSSWDAYWYPSGRWGPKAMRNRFGPLMGAMTWRWVAFGSAFRTLNVLLGVVNGLQNTSWCGSGVVALGVLHVLAAAGLCLARPLRLPMSAVCHPVAHVLAAAVCGLTYAQSTLSFGLVGSGTETIDSISEALVTLQILYAVVGVWRVLWVSWMSYREASWDSSALDKAGDDPDAASRFGAVGTEWAINDSKQHSRAEVDGKVAHMGTARQNRGCCRGIETLLHAVWFGGGGRGEEVPTNFVQIQNRGSCCTPESPSAEPPIGTLGALFHGDFAGADAQDTPMVTMAALRQLNAEVEDPSSALPFDGRLDVEPDVEPPGGTQGATVVVTEAPVAQSTQLDHDTAVVPSVTSPVGRSPTSSRALFGVENYFLSVPSPKKPQGDVL